MPARSPVVTGTREKTEGRAGKTSRGLEAAPRRDGKNGCQRCLRRGLRWPRWLGRVHVVFSAGVLLILWWGLLRLRSVWDDGVPDSGNEVLRNRLEDALKQRRFDTPSGRREKTSEPTGIVTKPNPVAVDDKNADGHVRRRQARVWFGLGEALGYRDGMSPKLFTDKSPPAGATTLKETVEQARKLSSPFLKYYLKALDGGLAKELMPDPFAYASEDDKAADIARGMQPWLQPWEKADSSWSPDDASDDGVATDACVFREGFDYAGEDAGSQERMSQKRCCKLCVQRNREWDGACQVAVLSSNLDNPPKTCWIKRAVKKIVHKPGVMACIPAEKVEELAVLSGETSHSLPDALSDHSSLRGGSTDKSEGQRPNCDFQEGVDYLGEDGTAVEGMTRRSCCELCVMRNRRRPGSCKVAVLSSKDDDPPLTCWVKKTKLKSLRKPGVVSCIPVEPSL